MNIETYISEFSKYVIALLMALYLFECIIALLHKNEEKRKALYIRQIILMFAFHFSCYMVICFETKEISFLVFYVFQQLVLYAVLMLYKSIYPNSNRLLMNNVCMFLSISFVILSRLDYSKAIKQFIVASASLVIALIIPFFIRNIRLIKNLKWIYAIMGVGALGVMMVLGQTTYGSKISYTIAGVSFQPAELVKIIFVFFVASALYKSSSFFEIFTSAFIAALHVMIQVANKDLGSALIFFAVYICMLYVASQNIIYLLLGLVGAGGASMVAYNLFSHIRVRVQAFLDPWTYIDSSGYQITQSLFAISSGDWFGLGLYKGNPNAIPFVEADFIFSAITEEFGVIFAVSLILLCLCTFLMIIRISLRLTDKFYQLVAFGLGVTYLFQVFLTIGGGTKFIPLTGVTLPLVSYGGTSVLITIVMFSIVEGLYIISIENNVLKLEYEQYEDFGESELYPDEDVDAQDERKIPIEQGSDSYRRQELNKKHKINDNKKSKPNTKSQKYEYDDFLNNNMVKTNGRKKPLSQIESDSGKNESLNIKPQKSSKKDINNRCANSKDKRNTKLNNSGNLGDANRKSKINKYIYDDIETIMSEEDDDDGLRFIHGFTIPVDVNLINKTLEEDRLIKENSNPDFENLNEEDIFMDIEPIGEIYYNEDEYEKDKKREKNKKK